MNDRELDRLVARANPLDRNVVRQLPTREVEHALSEEIITMIEPTTQKVRGWRRRAVVVAAAATAAAAVIVAATGILIPRGHPAAPASAYAAEVRAVAEASPRLLIDLPGWKVTHVETFSASEGEMTLANAKGSGHHWISVSWRDASMYQTMLTDRGFDHAKKPVKLLGQTGTQFDYSGSKEFITILPPQGKNFVELSGEAPEKNYQYLLGKLQVVDVDTWLDAMPESVVKPADGKQVVTQMLADIPVPAGFDPAVLYKQEANDRYDVGAQVVMSVTCRWLHQWADAKKSGDAQRVQQAVNAMKTSRSWKVLREMKLEGDYPDKVWEVADAIAKPGTPADYDGIDCSGAR
jgi:hypothetical protein